jgi:hypothetical protein
MHSPSHRHWFDHPNIWWSTNYECTSLQPPVTSPPPFTVLSSALCSDTLNSLCAGNCVHFKWKTRKDNEFTIFASFALGSESYFKGQTGVQNLYINISIKLHFRMVITMKYALKISVGEIPGNLYGTHYLRITARSSVHPTSVGQLIC